MENKKQKKDDIIIESVVTTSHDSVSSEEILESLKSELRFIHQLNTEYVSDEDFGRNVRKLLNTT